MERNCRFATWTGTILGIFVALLLNAALAHASDRDDTIASEEFHQTYPLTANGRISLENINGAVHVKVWDQNHVKVDAIKRAYDEERLKNAEIRAGTTAITTILLRWNTRSRSLVMLDSMRSS
jgi:hypothetical protein